MNLKTSTVGIMLIPFLAIMLFTSSVASVKAEVKPHLRQTVTWIEGDYETSPGFWILYTWEWVCLEKEQVEDYLDAVEITLWLDEKEVEIKVSDIYETEWEGNPAWAVRFSFLSHPLAKGEHLFLTRVILYKEVYDGLGYYGPGEWYFNSFVTVVKTI